MKLPAEDLEHILSHTSLLWREVKNCNLFITGGTGFFGIWLLESFVKANNALGLNATLFVLTRDILKFKKKAPHLFKESSIRLVEGDIQTFSFSQNIISYIIHGATSASATLNSENPLLMYDTIVNGTRRVLEFALKHKVRKMLFISSGAVYGTQSEYISKICENSDCSIDVFGPQSAYSIGKLNAEFLCSTYSRANNLNIKIARCFAFLGPHLPLNTHFAIGNFIKNKIEGEPITVKGDGSPYRSYLYAADLSVWLWTILFKGEICVPYNVGSEKEYSIKEIANTVSHSFLPVSKINIEKRCDINKKAEKYIPSTDRAQKELQLNESFTLSDSIKKTIKWLKS